MKPDRQEEYADRTPQVKLRLWQAPSTYTWSVVSGSLPPGLSIRTGRAELFPSHGARRAIGVATTPGTYPFTLQVTSNNQIVAQSASVHVTALALKDLNYIPYAFAGAIYPPYQLTPLNNAGPLTYKIISGTLPPGMNLSSERFDFRHASTSGNYS